MDVSIAKHDRSHDPSGEVMKARLRLLRLADRQSLAQLLQAMLDEAEALTDSKVSLYHFVKPDQLTIVPQAWSTNTTGSTCKTQGDGTHYSVNQGGVWTDCIRERRPVIHNDYASLPNRKGLPEGHTQIIRELLVPVLRGDAVVALLGVGNKPTNYDERDVEVVASLADFAWDIAESKRNEEALRESNERFLSLTSNIPAYIAYVNADTLRYEFVNAAFEKSFQIPREKIIGSHLKEIVGEANYQFALKAIHEVRLGKAISYENTFDLVHGKRWIQVNLTPVTNASGHVASIAVLSYDITERKRAEEEKKIFDAQNRQLQKSESLSRMAGAIAHHFNNQLQAVMMSLEMATQDLQNNAEPVENLSGAMKSARKAAEVSSLMLTYLGQTTAKRQPMDLSEACRRYVPMLRASMPKSVVLETDFPFSNSAINANENQVQQVLTNLVTNAWEASGDRQGAIRLTVKNVSSAVIPVTYRFPIDAKLQATDYACLEVADTGCGIAPADMDKLFDPFFSSKFTGRGLGLAVVLGIVRAHGGAVTVESQPHCGSVFRVFFPITAEAVARKHAQAAVPLQTAGGVTVLVVDDEPSVRKMVAFALKRSGFTVFAAEDGVQAVEVFQQHRDEIGCVLCDLTMPRMNGWETLAALRKLSPGIPVILASGYSEDQVMANDHPERPQAFLGKPYDLNTLREAIARVVTAPL